MMPAAVFLLTIAGEFCMVFEFIHAHRQSKAAQTLLQKLDAKTLTDTGMMKNYMRCVQVRARSCLNYNCIIFGPMIMEPMHQAHFCT